MKILSSDTRLTLTYDLTNCTTPSQYNYADGNYTMIFTANDNCQFVINDTATYLEYADSTTWIPDASRYVTVDGIVKQVKMITKMKDYPISAVMHVKAYQIQPVTVTLTQNLTNCSSNVTDTTVNPSTALTITLTANEGYKFNSVPTYLITELSTQYNFTRISDNVYTTEFTTPSNGSIVVNATAVEIVTISVIQNLTNCTSSISDTTVNPSTELLIFLTADTGYEFETLPSYSVNGVTSSFVRNSETLCYAEFTTPASGTIIVNATAIENGYSVEYHLSHCSVTPVISRIDYSQNITFTATADSGYKFDSTNPPYYTCGGISDKYRFSKVDDYTYTLDSDNVYRKRDLQIYATALQEITPPTPVEEISYGFINIYLPSMNTLKALSRYRFFNSDGENVDCFKYVYKVHKMYFNIPVEDMSYITLAKYRTNLTTNCTSNAFVSTNCGSVTVSELYHNVFDYQYTNARIYLPFIGYQNIDTNNIMNSTVNLEYRANIVTGKVIAIISTTERGNLYQFEGYGGFDIPYMINNFEVGLNHDLYQSSAYLGNFTPSLQLFTNIPYGDNNNPFGYGVSQWIKIGDCTGYIRCEDIQLVISQNYITNSEMNMIMDILKNGIFIN